MIIDRLDRADQYRGISARLAQALDYLRATDFSTLEPGKYVLDGDNLYAMVMNFTTSADENAPFEAHRKYIDVQYVVDGIDRMGYVDLDTLVVTQEYDESSDALLLKGKGDFLTVSPGSFIVFWPTDAHMPGMAVNEPQPVKKVVVKVRV